MWIVICYIKYTYIIDAVIVMFKIILENEERVYNISDERNEVSIKELAEIMADTPDRN